MRSSGSRFSLRNVFNLVLRFNQLVFAATVIGLYAQDLNSSDKVAKYVVSRWGYTVAVATLSGVTALIFGFLPLLISSFTSAILFGWDLVLFILWAVVFGLFGAMFINEDPKEDGGIIRMRNAVWVDLVNMLLWFVSTVMGAIGFWKWKKGGSSLHTGRATL